VKRVVSGTLAVLLLVLLPAAAQAATRYASPSGGTVLGCEVATPCSLDYAITAASANDTVIVEPGTYNVASTIEANVPLTIRGLIVTLGVRGEAPQTKIVGAPGITPLKSDARQTISDLRIESTGSLEGSLFFVGDGTLMERLVLIAHGVNSAALRPGTDFLLRDSLLVADGQEANGLFLQGVQAGEPQIRNDTIVASGTGSIGIALFVTKPATALTIHATNTIATAATDVSAAGTPESTPAIALDHSNLDTFEGPVTSTAGQSAPPLFADAAAGDYHELGASPTVDAGVNDPANGEFDLDGGPRALSGHPGCGPAAAGPTTDIGAYELSGPVVDCFGEPLDTRITKAKIRGSKRTAKFRFVSIGASDRFECKLHRLKRKRRASASAKKNGRQPRFRKCSSPKTYTGLKPGRYLFEVRAVRGSRVDPTPAKRRFRIKGGGPAARR
jgi:hypothetical protein